MNKFIFLFPTLAEQKQMSDILSFMDNKLGLLQKQKTEYTSLKKGLMEQLLTGKIRVKLN